MATVIYNHREMEYKCRKYWTEKNGKEPDFNNMIPEDEQRFKQIREELKHINSYDFDEEYAMDYGLDTLRLYVLFEGYPKNEDDWKEGSLEGIYKFLNRFMTLVENSVSATMGIAHNEKKALRYLENTELDADIRQQVDDKKIIFFGELQKALERNHFHGIVAAFMEYSTNLAQISKKNEICIDKEVLQELVVLLAPFAPYMSEYLWQLLSAEQSVFEQAYAFSFEKDLSVKQVDVAIQINGKTKKILKVDQDCSQEQIASEVQSIMKDQMPEQIDRVIYVPGKVYNMIVK